MELLYLPECPNHCETAEMVRSVMRAKGVTAEPLEIAITNYEEASANAFPGSPTIRVNGRDIESLPPHLPQVGFVCRTYRVEGRVQGIPPRAWLEQAIRAAQLEESNR